MRVTLLGLLMLPLLAMAATPPKTALAPDLTTLEYLADWPDADQAETPSPDDPVLVSLDALNVLAPPTGEAHDAPPTKR